MTQTSLLRVLVDDHLKKAATEKLSRHGLTISDAIRMLLLQITQEDEIPVSLITDQSAHDTWFREQVNQALNGDQETFSHQQVMDEAQQLIDGKRKLA